MPNLASLQATSVRRDLHNLKNPELRPSIFWLWSSGFIKAVEAYTTKVSMTMLTHECFWLMMLCYYFFCTHVLLSHITGTLKLTWWALLSLTPQVTQRDAFPRKWLHVSLHVSVVWIFLITLITCFSGMLAFLEYVLTWAVCKEFCGLAWRCFVWRSCESKTGRCGIFFVTFCWLLAFSAHQWTAYTLQI